MQVEKFLSSQYVKFIIEVQKLLMSDLNKNEIYDKIEVIKQEIIKKYNLSEKDLQDDKK